MGNTCLMHIKPGTGTGNIDGHTGNYVASSVNIDSFGILLNNGSNGNNVDGVIDQPFVKHKRKGGRYVLSAGEELSKNQADSSNAENDEDAISPAPESNVADVINTQDNTPAKSDGISSPPRVKPVKTRPPKVPDHVKNTKGLNDKLPNASKSDTELHKHGKGDMDKTRSKSPASYSLKVLRKTFHHDFQTFLLNNVLLGVQFGQERELLSRARATMKGSASPSASIDTRQNEMCTRLHLTGHHKRAVCPDALHEHIASMVRYCPPSAPGSTSHGVPLRPIRVMICHEDVDVIDQEHVYSDSRVGDQVAVLRVQLEQTQQAGFVKLRNYDTKSETPARSSVTGSYDEIEEDGYANLSEYSNNAGRENHIHSSSSDLNSEAEDTIALPPRPRSIAEIAEIHVHPAGVVNGVTNIPRVPSGPILEDLERETLKKSKSIETINGVRKLSHIDKADDDLITTERRLSKSNANSRQKLKSPKRYGIPVPTMNVQLNKQTGSNSSNDSSGYKSGSLLPNVPSSHRSTDSDSEYGYTTINNLNSVLTLEEKRRKSRSTGTPLKIGFPSYCFIPVTFRYLSDDETSNDLFQTKQYFSSNAFMDHFSNIFAEYIAIDVGFAPNAINNATVRGATITCQTTSLKLDIIPTVNCPYPNWPEKATEWLHRSRPSALDKRTNKIYTWPTKEMIQNARKYGYHLVPLGYAPRRGGNPNLPLEWTIEFPEAEKYLETCLDHVKLRCYIFCLIIFQAFLSGPDGLNENHIRQIIFWQAEKLALTWANFEMCNNINAVLGYAYTALSKPMLPNYFIHKRNEFQSIPRTRLLAVQSYVHKFRENPFGYMLAALKNVTYPNSPYPTLEYDKLLRILKTTYIVELVNPALGTMAPAPQIETAKNKKGSEAENEGFWSVVKKPDPQKRWKELYHQRVEEERKAKEKTKTKQSDTKPETVSNYPQIEINLSKNKFQESPVRRRLVLELFIEHFIKLAHKSIELNLRSQSRDYLAHTENLYILLQENSDKEENKVVEIRQQLDELTHLSKQMPLSAVKAAAAAATNRVNKERKQLELPKNAEMYRDSLSRISVTENWKLQSLDSDFSEAQSTDAESYFWGGNRFMREAPASMLYLNDHQEDEVSTDL